MASKYQNNNIHSAKEDWADHKDKIKIEKLGVYPVTWRL
jgi:hypothetical protein